MKNKILIAAFAAAVCASASFGEGMFLGIEGDYSFNPASLLNGLTRTILARIKIIRVRLRSALKAAMILV